MTEHERYLKQFSDVIDAVFAPKKDKTAKILLMAQREMINPTRPDVSHYPVVRVKGDKNYE